MEFIGLCGFGKEAGLRVRQGWWSGELSGDFLQPLKHGGDGFFQRAGACGDAHVLGFGEPFVAQFVGAGAR